MRYTDNVLDYVLLFYIVGTYIEKIVLYVPQDSTNGTS